MTVFHTQRFGIVGPAPKAVRRRAPEVDALCGQAAYGPLRGTLCAERPWRDREPGWRISGRRDTAPPPGDPAAVERRRRVSWLRQRRNAQHLARIDLVRVAQHRAVGLEDDVVLVALALAVLPLGDRPQRVAGHDRVELRLGRRRGRLDVVLHGRDALGVAEGDGDLLGLFLCLGGAGHLHLVAVDLDLDVGRVEAVLLELLLELLGGRGLGGITSLMIRLIQNLISNIHKVTITLTM